MKYLTESKLFIADKKYLKLFEFYTYTIDDVLNQSYDEKHMKIEIFKSLQKFYHMYRKNNVIKLDKIEDIEKDLDYLGEWFVGKLIFNVYGSSADKLENQLKVDYVFASEFAFLLHNLFKYYYKRMNGSTNINDFSKANLKKALYHKVLELMSPTINKILENNTTLYTKYDIFKIFDEYIPTHIKRAGGIGLLDIKNESLYNDKYKPGDIKEGDVVKKWVG